MSSPGGYSQHDAQNGGGHVDPLTGQPLHNPQQSQQPYGGSAQYPPPAARPPGNGKNGTAALVAVLVGIVVLVSAGGVGIYLWLADPVEPKAVPVASPQSTSPATSAAPSTSESQTRTRTTEESAVPDVKPTIPGWQPVADPRTSIAYDLPPGWKVESPSVLVGFEDESGPRVAMHAVGTYQYEACPDVSGSYRGRTGIWGDPMKDIDPRDAAEVGARLWATAAAEVPKDDPSVPRPQAKRITLASGLQAWKATITITPPDGACSAPEVKFTTVSFIPPTADGAVLFVMYNDQGVPDALPGEAADKIISTLRPIG